jgi:hypothetical protein
MGQEAGMTILVKYATRGRPAIFLHRLREYIDGAKNPSDCIFLISYDADDPLMGEDVIAAAERMHPNVRCVRGNSKSKIEAINADINAVKEPWSVVIVFSDDMQLRLHHWDERVRMDMQHHYPDTDGCLWYHDASKQRDISTLSCIGRAYYNRFGFIYEPSYYSFFCDDEYTAVAQEAGKITFSETVIASHEHPSWGAGMKRDHLYDKNGKYWAQDKANFARRSALGFPA